MEFQWELIHVFIGIIIRLACHITILAGRSGPGARRGRTGPGTRRGGHVETRSKAQNESSIYLRQVMRDVYMFGYSLTSLVWVGAFTSARKVWRCEMVNMEHGQSWCHPSYSSSHVVDKNGLISSISGIWPPIQYHSALYNNAPSSDDDFSLPVLVSTMLA